MLLSLVYNLQSSVHHAVYCVAAQWNYQFRQRDTPNIRVVADNIYTNGLYSKLRFVLLCDITVYYIAY